IISALEAKRAAARAGGVEKRMAVLHCARLIVAFFLVCSVTGPLADAQQAQRWVHPTQAFSVDLTAGGGAWRTSSEGATTIFQLNDAQFVHACTLVVHALPTTRIQSQLNATTGTYRLN